MDLPSLARQLRKLWWLVALTAVVGALVGGGIAAISPLEYRATTRLYIVPALPAEARPSDVAQATGAIAERAAAYASVVNTPLVLDRVVQRLGLPVTAADLSGKISASVEPNSVILDITATDANPEQAALLANTTRSEFISVLTTQLEVPAGGGPSTVRGQILQEAIPPKAAAGTGLALTAAFGLVGGALVGLIVVGVQAAVDRRVHSRGDLERRNDVRVLISIPAERHRRAAASGPGEDDRAYQALGETVLLTEAGTNSIALTSAGDGAESTTAARRLAIALARGGRRVVLVDGDAVNHRVSAEFGLVGVRGLSDVAGSAEPPEPIPTDIPNLSVVSAGTRSFTPHPDALVNLFGALAARADVVIVDAPPALASGSALVVATAVDRTLVVVPAGEVTAADVESVIEGLTNASADISGAVLVNVPTSGPDSDPQSRALAAEETRPRRSGS